MRTERFTKHVRRLRTRPVGVGAAVVLAAAILVGAFRLIVAVLPSSITNTDVSALQGEKVEVEGGDLIAFGWCAFETCPDGGEGDVWVWVKACAAEDDWEVDAADFAVHGARRSSPRPLAAAPPGAFGRRVLAARSCAEGVAAFDLGERPTDFFYEGHGFRVNWLLDVGAVVPLTRERLERIPAANRRWLLSVEMFYRRVIALLPRDPGFTLTALDSLASLDDDCYRTLAQAGEPGRFVAASVLVEGACKSFRDAAGQFAVAAAHFDDPEGDPEFGKALDRALAAALPGRDTLIRAHDRALAIAWSRH